jgi:hypothetical protein
VVVLVVVVPAATAVVVSPMLLYLLKAGLIRHRTTSGYETFVIHNTNTFLVFPFSPYPILSYRIYHKEYHTLD